MQVNFIVVAAAILTNTTKLTELWY